MGFTDAGRPDEENIMVFPDELAGGNVVYLPFVDRRVKTKIEVLNGFGIAESGGLCPSADSPVVPDRQFIINQQFEKFPVG